jgi:hypothetical protein
VLNGGKLKWVAHRARQEGGPPTQSVSRPSEWIDTPTPTVNTPFNFEMSEYLEGDPFPNRQPIKTETCDITPTRKSAQLSGPQTLKGYVQSSSPSGNSREAKQLDQERYHTYHVLNSHCHPSSAAKPSDSANSLSYLG